jgi:hypothetical protein
MAKVRSIADATISLLVGIEFDQQASLREAALKRIEEFSNLREIEAERALEDIASYKNSHLSTTLLEVFPVIDTRTSTIKKVK